MTIPEQIQVEIFRTGNYGEKGTYGEADLDRIAESYDPAVHEAPVTFDHEQKGPAHGWVKSLSRLGDRLVATIGRVSEGLHQALTSQSFKKRSIELYRRFPKTGEPYLKAVSFLGAAAPEVKGLADPVFAEGAEQTVCFAEEAMTADQAKALLMEKGLWRPEWEERGVAQLFAAIAHTDHGETLIALLTARDTPVSFGRMESEGTGGSVAFAEDPPAGATPSSLLLHRRACALLRENPSLSYRDALLKLS
jgi:hypothetical protein